MTRWRILALLPLLGLFALAPRQGLADPPALAALCRPSVGAEGLVEALAWASYRDGAALCFGPFVDADVAEASRGAHASLLADAWVAEFPASRSAPEVWTSAPVSVEGLVPQIGFLRGRQRDVVLIHLMDSFEGEPGEGKLFILDGPSGRVELIDAWDGTLTADEAEVVYGRGWGLSSEDGSVDREALIGAVATASGLSRSEVERGVFSDGFTDSSAYAVQPFSLDLSTGRRRPFPFAGGGALGRIEGRVLASRLPRYWAFPSWDDQRREPVFELNTTTRAATPVPEVDIETARQQVERGSFRYRMVEERVPAEKGRSFARTRGGCLMLRVVSAIDGRGARWQIQALRRAASPR